MEKSSPDDDDVDDAQIEMGQAVGLSVATEIVLWLLLFAVTFVVEVSTFKWLPASNFAAGLSMMRLAQLAESHVTSLLLQLNIELTTTYFLRRVAFYGCMGMSISSILSSLGFETDALVNVITSASFAIGLASQQALKDVAAGVMLMIWRPFRVGDLIELQDDGIRGWVYDILLTETRIDTEANVRVSIPNSEIFGKVTMNHSSNRVTRVDINLDIPLEKDVQGCKRVMLEELFAQNYAEFFLKKELPKSSAASSPIKRQQSMQEHAPKDAHAHTNAAVNRQIFSKVSFP
jgi:small-conductance mechanosensitive channel